MPNNRQAERGFVWFPKGMPVRKRVFDLLLVLLFMPLWVPLLVMALLLVWIKLGKPLMFYQWRQGYQGKPFLFGKLRTMTSATDAKGELLPDEQRATRIGTLLRSFSFDELPQLLLVLQGRMSLVGPRPLPVIYDERYSPQQRRRFEVYPGITGLAQVSGRNLLSWEQRFACDIEYVEHWSWMRDLRILVVTVIQQVLRTHTRQEGSTFSSPFEPKDKR